MDKDKFLQELTEKVSSGEIRHDEVINRINLIPRTHTSDIGYTPVTPSTPAVPASSKDSHFSLTKLLYVLGAAVVVIGIIIFVAQVWDDIGSISRVGVTLGLGLLLTIIGSALITRKPEDKIGIVFQIIGGALIPGGSMVALSEFTVAVPSIWSMSYVFGAIFVFYLLLNFAYKNFALTFFTILNATAFLYFTVGAMIDGLYYAYEDLFAYLTMVVGLSYLFLAHAFIGGWNSKLVRILNFLGTVGFMGAAFSQVFDSVIWQLLFFVFVAGGIALAAHVRDRGILLVSTLFLIAHITYITSEYFADSIGWPVALVILGFVFIGLGYVSININKKYISSKKV